MKLDLYIKRFAEIFPDVSSSTAWLIVPELESILRQKLATLNTSDYDIRGDIAIHRTATVEQGVVMKGLAIIGEGCFVGAHAYLRGGVFLERNVIIGPGCEVKSSIVFSGTALAHFNFVGDSIIGAYVNMEAGAVIANHWNERTDKEIEVISDGNRIRTGVKKFGALVGDNARIGANAVLSPGTILSPGQIVGRLELVKQT